MATQTSAAKKPAAKKPAAKKAAPAKASKPPVKQKVQAKAAPKEKAPTPAADEQKVVRDGFTMPQADYDKIKALKALCLKNGVEVKKSTVLRAGLQALQALPVAELLAVIAALAPIKAGRKKKKA